MKGKEVRQLVGLLIILSCVISAPSVLSAAVASFHVGADYSNSGFGLLVGVFALLSWALAVVAGIVLVMKKSYGLLVTIVAALIGIFFGGPVFVPFVGQIVGGGISSFVVVNVMVVCIVAVWGRKTIWWFGS